MRRQTIWICPECGEVATDYPRQMGKRGHFHRADERVRDLPARWFEAKPVEVVPLSEVREALLGEEALERAGEQAFLAYTDEGARTNISWRGLTEGQRTFWRGLARRSILAAFPSDSEEGRRG